MAKKPDLRPRREEKKKASALRRRVLAEKKPEGFFNEKRKDKIKAALSNIADPTSDFLDPSKLTSKSKSTAQDDQFTGVGFIKNVKKS